MAPPLQNGFDASPYYRVGELHPHQQGNLLVIRLPGSQSEPAVPHASKKSGQRACLVSAVWAVVHESGAAYWAEVVGAVMYLLTLGTLRNVLPSVM